MVLLVVHVVPGTFIWPKFRVVNGKNETCNIAYLNVLAQRKVFFLNYKKNSKKDSLIIRKDTVD